MSSCEEFFPLPSLPGWGREGNTEALGCKGGEAVQCQEGLSWSEMKVEDNNAGSCESSGIYGLVWGPSKICSCYFMGNTLICK